MCIEVRDLVAGDQTDRGTVDKIEHDDETVTIVFRHTGDRLALWHRDHAWVERAVVAS